MEAVAPAPFIEALTSLRNATIPQGLAVEEVPGPSRSAPYTAAIRISGHSNAATHLHDNASDSVARFVILHDPSGQPGWNGTFRLIVMVHAPIEHDIAQDQFASEVAWSWFGEALEKAGAGYHDVAGTVTRTIDQSFGSIRYTPPQMPYLAPYHFEDQPPNSHDNTVGPGRSEAYLELRASWTPTTPDLQPHFEAVCALLEFMSLGAVS
ncbi:MAG: DUF3000 family protein [Actinomycetaceae bacterium]|nr:DUF3000 family protein [Actinomycetaceae bacterium]